MTAAHLPPPPVNQPMEDGSGNLTNIWSIWFARLYDRLGGSSDKVEAAYSAALAAAPAATQVVGVGGLHVGGDLSGNVALAFYSAVTNVATLPAAGNTEGDWAYAVDGCKVGEAAGAGTGAPVWWSNGNWYAVDSGGVVTA